MLWFSTLGVVTSDKLDLVGTLRWKGYMLVMGVGVNKLL